MAKQMSKQGSSKTKCTKRGRPVPPKQTRHKKVAGSKSAVRHKEKKTESLALQRAKTLANGLGTKYPKFLKKLAPSTVSGGFWLGLPVDFCRENMGDRDKKIVLEDAKGEMYEVKYLGVKAGLSGGWRGFSIAHDLHPGDVLVFQKLDECKFKVHIIRNTSADEVDSRSLNSSADTQLEASSNISEAEEDMLDSIDNYDWTDDDDDDFVPDEVSYRFSDSPVPLEQVTCMDHFKIIINGVNINSKYTKPVLKRYYDLCRSQNSYLHQNLAEDIDSDLAAVLISNTVNIAAALSATKDMHNETALCTWDKTLQAAETCGLSISFLRNRLNRLRALAAENTMAKELSRERDRERAECRARLEELEEADGEEAERSALRPIIFKQVANAPF